MIRKKKYFPIPGSEELLPKLIHWIYQHDHFSLFNGNEYQINHGPFLTFATAGSLKTFIPLGGDPFLQLREFYRSENDWLIGRLSYDLKNSTENLASMNTDRLEADEMVFFIPETLIFMHPDKLEVHSIHEPEDIYREIIHMEQPGVANFNIHFSADMTKEEYVEAVSCIKEHIVEGDFYEMNFCMEFFGRTDRPDLASLYLRLNDISPMPFSVFQRSGGQFLLSASPERFLKKSGKCMIAQPIKGTIRRDNNPDLDDRLKQQLRNSEKEKAENMMIVDLMRNDLGRSAVAGSVKVPEIFKIYSYSHVHQMISTITATLSDEVHFVDAIRHAFPMGSMTGAPKIKVMEMIDHYEKSKRGLFSGAAGYITPDGDFDFNVLIRSIFYSDITGYMKFCAGSAITYDADPEYEYHECILKTRAMREALGLSPL